MNICVASNNVGSLTLSFSYDNHSLDSWFEVHAAVYTKDDGRKIVRGFYKVQHFKSLRAAKNKFDALSEKYGIK